MFKSGITKFNEYLKDVLNKMVPMLEKFSDDVSITGKNRYTSAQQTALFYGYGEIERMLNLKLKSKALTQENKLVIFEKLSPILSFFRAKYRALEDARAELTDIQENCKAEQFNAEFNEFFNVNFQKQCTELLDIEYIIPKVGDKIDNSLMEISSTTQIEKSRILSLTNQNACVKNCHRVGAIDKQTKQVIKKADVATYDIIIPSTEHNHGR